MKSSLSFLLIFFSILKVSGQDQELKMPVDGVSGLITYQEVINIQGTKDELFNRCSSWLHTFYANPWEATKVRDQATGLIKVQHQFRVYDMDENGNKIDAGMILYTLVIEFKEGRYRYTVDNFLLKAISRYPIENWMDKSRPDYDAKYENYMKQINSFVTDELIKTLKEGMVPADEIKEEDW